MREGRREHAKRLPLLQPAEIAATLQPARTTWPSGSLGAATGNVGVRLRPLRLKEFDGVAGWILDEDLAAARPFDDLTTEARPLSSETLNARVEIGNDDLEPIPSSRLRNATGFARAAYARLVEKQSQVILRQAGESRGKGKVDTKAEAIAVEVDRLVDVCDEVTHSRLRHVRFLRFVSTNSRSLAERQARELLRAKRTAVSAITSGDCCGRASGVYPSAVGLRFARAERALHLGC